MHTLCKVLFLAMTILLLTQCRMAECNVVMADVDIDDWSDEATISYINQEDATYYDLNITLHVNRRFKAHELELEITTMTPDSLRYSERVTLPVNVTWDNPSVATCDVELPYRQNVHLRRKGVYNMVITPQQSVVGVEAAGVNFQKKR